MPLAAEVGAVSDSKRERKSFPTSQRKARSLELERELTEADGKRAWICWLSDDGILGGNEKSIRIFEVEASHSDYDPSSVACRSACLVRGSRLRLRRDV